MFCDFNCGNNYSFVLDNGKKCCQSSYRKCEGYRKTMKESCKQSYNNDKRKSGRDNYLSMSDESKKSMSWSRGKILKSFDDIFCKNSTASNHLVKKSLLTNKIVENKCNSCSISSWLDNPISLELDHIDGNSTNNTVENLRLLCPNCHSQTPTFRGRNINSGSKKVSDEELIALINESKNTRESLLKAGLAPKGGNYTRVSKLIASGAASFCK